MKRILSFMLSILLVVSITPVCLATTQSAVAAANNLYSLGLFLGTGSNADGTPKFDLDSVPNRNQGAIMLVRLLGKENNANEGTWHIPFTDVPSWAKPYVGYAYQNKLTLGVSTKKYGGKQKITAAQYTTFVLRSLGYEDPKDFSWSNPFTLSDNLGITNGKYRPGNGKFTRGDMAIISNNALDVKIKGSNKTLLEFLTESGAITKPGTSTDPSDPTPTPPITDKVYWTETGSRYHKTQNCVTLKNAKKVYSGSLEDGKSNGRTPCKVCW